MVKLSDEHDLETLRQISLLLDRENQRLITKNLQLTAELARLRDHLIALGEWDDERQEKLDLDCAEQVKAATKEAEKNGILGHGLHHPFHTMFEDVYEELPWHLEEQAAQAIREREIKWPAA